MPAVAVLPHCAPVTTKPPRSSIDAAAVEPVGRRIGADEQEQIADHRLRSRSPAQAAAPAHALERPSSRRRAPTTSVLKHQFDVRRGLDALDQIARHAGAEPAAADHHVDLAGMAGEKHRGLPGGIAAADQHDLLVRAQPRLDRRGPVPDAAAFELREILDLGPAVARAARHHDGSRAHQLRRHSVASAKAPSCASNRAT